MSDHGDLSHVGVDDTGGWDATHEAAAAAAAAHAAAHAAAVGHIPEHHHHGHSTADPVLAAATAAAMDAAAPAADDSATEAAVAVAAALPEEQQQLEHDDDEDNHQHLVPGGVAGGTKTRKNFDERLKELRKFKLKHGHTSVPHKYPHNPQLGTWVDTQRRLYRNHKRHPERPTTLTPENIEKLMEIGFNFEPRPSREETWNNRLAELAQFKSQHGHCNVREDDQTYPGLGKWVSYVRRQYRLIRQGRRAKDTRRLDSTRMNQLREIGFVFELREEMAHKRFREGIGALREFMNEHGHTAVPNFYDKNPTLGLVVEEMKREANKLHMGQPSTMNEDMLAELVELGVVGPPGSMHELEHQHEHHEQQEHIHQQEHVHQDVQADVQAEVTAQAAAAAAAALEHHHGVENTMDV